MPGGFWRAGLPLRSWVVLGTPGSWKLHSPLPFHPWPEPLTRSPTMGPILRLGSDSCVGTFSPAPWTQAQVGASVGPSRTLRGQGFFPGHTVLDLPGHTAREASSGQQPTGGL